MIAPARLRYPPLLFLQLAISDPGLDASQDRKKLSLASPLFRLVVALLFWRAVALQWGCVDSIKAARRRVGSTAPRLTTETDRSGSNG